MNSQKALAGIALLVALFAFAPTASATLIDELVDGDLSGDPANPTEFTLEEGLNSILGTTVAGDFDLFSISIGAGDTLTSLELAEYDSIDNLGFIGVQTTSTWTEGLGGAINPANLLGWSHFGPGNGTVGTDILDNIGTGPGAIGFVPPLGPGDYTFLVQQTGGAAIDYRFDLTLTSVPEPASLALLGIGLAAVGLVRRQRS